MRTVATALAFVMFATACLANPLPRKIGWNDLAVQLTAAENPYYGLSGDEARLIEVLVHTAQARVAGHEISLRALKGERMALSALDSVGIDGRAKVRELAAFEDKLEFSRSALNEALLDRLIEIPGFVLPLEFNDTRITEFILVPFAGACVHTPPPPSNQMIIVRLPEGFKLDGIFKPVVVSGRLTQGTESRSVRLSDGDAEFEVGYQLDANSVRAF